jgi:hypothetical protein
MCEVYGVGSGMIEVLLTLAAETKARGWWNAWGDMVPAWFQLFVGLETSASRLRWHEEALVPGLLQTRGYMVALFGLRTDWSEEERERSIELRLHRQRLLTRRLPPAPRLEAILSEGVLRRVVGDRRAKVDQLDHLVAVNEQANISVRVLPLAAGLPKAPSAGSFVILEFPRGNGRSPAEPTTVYSDSLTGALYLDAPRDVAAYEDAWNGLDALALDRAESERMINKIKGEI